MYSPATMNHYCSKYLLQILGCMGVSSALLGQDLLKRQVLEPLGMNVVVAINLARNRFRPGRRVVVCNIHSFERVLALGAPK